MAILTFPSLTPSSAEFGQMSNTQAFSSPLSGTTQTLEMPGARWHLRALFSGLDDTERRTLQAFLVQCRGMGGRFYYGDPAFLVDGPDGSAPGTPLVKGASQTGTSLITDGWGLNQTGLLKKGDYIHFDNSSGGRELHMVVADASSDGTGTGAATLTIEPAIRVSPADNAAITVTGAKCQMRLVADNVAKWSLSKPLIGSIEIRAIETFTDTS